MIKGIHRNIHPLLKLAEWLMAMALCTALVFVLWQLLPVNHGSIGSLLMFQALQAVGLFILPAFIVAYLWSDKPLHWLRLSAAPAPSAESRQGSLVLLSIGIILTAIPLINCLVLYSKSLRLPQSLSTLEQLMQQLEQQAEMLLQGFMTYRDGVWWMLLVNLFVLAVLPAIGEELAFRGVMQQLLTPNNQSPQITNHQSPITNHLAVWLTAFIFSFVHFQFYGFVPRLLLGAVLGYALAWSGRIGYSMLMHATNNALSVLLFYFGTYVWQLPQDTIDAIGTGDTWWLTALCTPLMLFLLYRFYARTRNHTHVD